MANGSQTALSCALYQGLAAPEEVPPLVEQLAANVQQHAGHLDAGILGMKYLFHALSDNDHVDAAYRIATQTTPPSYGSWLQRGATTLWEDWGDGASRDHVMLGSISAWFYQVLAGINIDPEQPAFKHVIIHPQPVGDLKWVRAEHQTIYGPLSVAWQREGQVFSMRVSVPVSATATVYVPAQDAASVRRAGPAGGRGAGVRFLHFPAARRCTKSARGITRSSPRMGDGKAAK